MLKNSLRCILDTSGLIQNEVKLTSAHIQICLLVYLTHAQCSLLNSSVHSPYTDGTVTWESCSVMQF